MTNILFQSFSRKLDCKNCKPRSLLWLLSLFSGLVLLGVEPANSHNHYNRHCFHRKSGFGSIKNIQISLLDVLTEKIFRISDILVRLSSFSRKNSSRFQSFQVGILVKIACGVAPLSSEMSNIYCLFSGIDKNPICT